MNVLVIANSFGDDANRYLHQIARADGVDIQVCTLYIGGCTLDTHYRNLLGDKEAYGLHYNGQNTGFTTSISEALLSRQWDVVTIQQGSKRSYDPKSFEPYAVELADYIRECQPEAKLLVHQTWAYKEGSERMLRITPYTTFDAMFADIEKAYDHCVELVNADGLIPGGKLMQELLHKGVECIHRDNLHVTKGMGRYALALLWYRMLTGNSVADNTFRDFDEPVTEEEIALAKSCVDAYTPIFQ